MSSGFVTFPPGWLIDPDPFALSMLESWLGQYINLRTTAPEMIEGMRAQAGEFEMVPVPIKILEQLAPEASEYALRRKQTLLSAGGASGFFGPRLAESRGPQQFTATQASESVAASRKARYADAAIALVKDLTAGIERGDHSFLLGLIAEDYRDPTGRGKSDVSEAIERLLKVSPVRRVILTKVDQYEAVGDDLVVAVSGAWQAEIAGDGGTKIEADLLKLELILTQDRDGRWKIAAARHA